MKRKLVLYPLIGVLVIAAGVVGLWCWLGVPGPSPLKQWIGSQVKSIANSYLNPRLDFDNLDYQSPYSVTLTKFRLSVDDPDNAGKTLDVIYVEKLRLELAEIPSEGKPIRIKEMILDHPKINAISARRDGKFMGFSNMLRDTTQAGTQPAQESSRLSDVFQITLLQIIDGQMVYESRGSGQPPMILDAINSRLDVQKDQQGWYKLAATLDRKPVLALNAKGRLDLDHMVLAMDAVQLDIELGEKQYSTLPASLQQMLREHEVTGALKLTASGQLPLGDPVLGDLTATLSMDSAHFVAGEYKGEAHNLKANLLLKDRHAVLDRLDADTLRGKVHLDVNVGLISPFDGRIQLTARDIRLQDTLRAAGGGTGPTKYKGIMDADILLTGPMDKILTQSGGSGWVKLHNGRLVGLRIMSGIGEALSQKIKSIPFIGGQTQSYPDTDTADLEFQFMGDKVHFTKIDAQTSTFAITGHGDAWFDKRLALMLNGGQPDKLRAATSGGGGSGNQVVDALGKLLHGAEHGAQDIGTEILSQVATVVVSGTIDDPQVRVEPFQKLRDLVGGK
jgi:uncharacterized protein involved in outer membrane biogenesis